ncbi:hypothetical protein GOBAR_DD08121 [Gossypium barbadense]|nr:hypothetical protein GOBAR_DD08121 [Gossypium barbadense]
MYRMKYCIEKREKGRTPPPVSPLCLLHLRDLYPFNSVLHRGKEGVGASRWYGGRGRGARARRPGFLLRCERKAAVGRAAEACCYLG